ncbi:MAG: Crp/Fnr family transcriptional regulator [Burkholderiales bacterium]
MARPQLDIRSLLAHVPLFRQVAEPQLSELARGCRELRPKRGEMIFQRGDPANGFYIVAHGQIKLAFPSAHGGEKVVEIIGAGQSFGEAVMFMEKPYPVFAQALVDSLLLHVAKGALFQAMDSDPGLARKMLAGLSLRLHSLIHDMETYCSLSGTQRVVGYLLQHECLGQPHAAVELPASKQVIASRLNLTPETFSRILHHLSEAGLIRVEGRRITIPDVDALRRHQGGS